MEVVCPTASICSGCSSWGTPLHQQRQQKQTRFLELLRGQGLSEPKDLSWARLPGFRLRDRLDFQIQQGRLGLWNKDRTEILDLPACLQLSPSLESWFLEFRTVRLPIERGSFRLRINARGDKGLWLDLSNQDVKALFEERSTLERLASMANVIEIGQRRKHFRFEKQTPKLLKDPVFHPWTETWLGETPFPLLSRIGDFSQVGSQANREIIRSLLGLVPESHNLVEFGSGTGNLTFAAAAKAKNLKAYEFDQSSALAFQANQQAFEKLSGNSGIQIKLKVGNFQTTAVDLKNCDTVLVNPPRSGLGSFLKELPSSPVQNLVYMSCFPESMVQDLRANLAGWRCQKLILIDQFPQTEHLEVMGLWTRHG
ncbi:MAG: methyltransferase [Bdellovibrio sp.]